MAVIGPIDSELRGGDQSCLLAWLIGHASRAAVWCTSARTWTAMHVAYMLTAYFWGLKHLV